MYEIIYFKYFCFFLFNSLFACYLSAPLSKYIKAIPEAFAPTETSPRAASYDLKSILDTIVPARGKSMINTGLKMEIPKGCYERVAPRSGLTLRNSIDVGAGVIDEDYRGLIMIILFNHSDIDVHIKRGDRIAQLICEKIEYPELEEVQSLDKTKRGEDGLGSFGI